MGEERPIFTLYVSVVAFFYVSIMNKLIYQNPIQQFTKDGFLS